MPVFLFSQKKVLIIGIDGLRADVLSTANTPNIDRLIANGTYSFDALTQTPTSSGPGWSSMLTGVWADKHKVYDNSFSDPNYAEYPHFFKRIKAKHPNWKTASVVHWGPINNFIVEEADISLNVTSDESVKDVGINVLNEPELAVLFLHFDDVDVAGHSYGFHSNIPQYISAVEKIDSYIGQVLSAVEERSIVRGEEWAIVVSTDHGGLGTSHGGASYSERNIFIIVSGEDIPKREIKVDTISVTSIESPKGYAIQFTGNNYARIENLQLNSNEFKDFTIELRVKANNWTGDPSLLSNKNWDSGRNPGFVIAAQTNGQSWKFNWGDGSQRIDLNGGIINDGEWHHLAVSLACGGKATIYQDGEEIASLNNTVACNANSLFDIAIAQDGTLEYPFSFPGQIDEIRIWNKVIDMATLNDWRCASLTTSHPDYAALKGYWPMEAGTGSFLQDNSESDHPATLLREPTWQRDQFISCQEFETSGETPSMVDILPSVLALLACEVDPSWGLDGNSLVPISPVTSTPDEVISKSSFKVFPNPVEERLSVVIKQSRSTPYQISIIDISGRELLQKQNIRNSVVVDFSSLSSGIYFYQISDAQLNIVKTGKLIKIR